jgi:hypothetical protein
MLTAAFSIYEFVVEEMSESDVSSRLSNDISK